MTEQIDFGNVTIRVIPSFLKGTQKLRVTIKNKDPMEWLGIEVNDEGDMTGHHFVAAMRKLYERVRY